MVVETLWPDNAPWWLNLFIWMAFSWYYILIGFVPAFYIAIAKLFGMPLLQRWANEVVITLYPTKVKFGKITRQMESFIKNGDGVYWPDKPLNPQRYEIINPKYQKRLTTAREQYETLSNKQDKTPKDEAMMRKLLKQQDKLSKQVLTVNPVNQLHIFAYAINQEIHTMGKRRPAKIGEMLNDNPNPKKIKGHGVWFLQNPILHFHRHFLLVVDKTVTDYVLIPVKDRQQFSIGFWHSLGIAMEKEIEIEEPKDIETNSGGGTKKVLIQQLITTNVITQQIDQVQKLPYFSASRAAMILKRRAKIESPFGFNAWIQGNFDARILLLLAGMVGAVAIIYLMFHGSSPTTAGPTGPSRIL